MARQVETVAWANQVPLAQIRLSMVIDLTPLQVQEATGLDFGQLVNVLVIRLYARWGDDV